jgi:hypothetical protein
MENNRLWEKGKHPDQEKYDNTPRHYEKWAGTSPDPDEYMEKPFKNPIAFQMYETVSEGTPVSPVFKTKEELKEYLIKNGDFWDQTRGTGGWTEKQATRFVEAEWQPTGMLIIPANEGLNNVRR